MVTLRPALAGLFAARGDMIDRVVSLFTGRSLPASCRAAYRRELLSSALVPFFITCLHPDVIGTIAQRFFHAGKALIATISASPHIGFLTVALTSRWIAGHDRIRIVTLARIVMLACTLLIVFVPTTPRGAYIVAALVIAGQSALALGWVALSDVWRTNYPRSQRASITGRFWIVITAASSVLTLALSRAFESGPTSFRSVFIAGCAVGSVGVIALATVRWRTRAKTIAAERGRPRPSAIRNLVDMVDVLRSDGAYRRYMTAQMVMGIPNLAASAPLIIALDEPLGVSDSAALLITFLAPLLATLVALPAWAALLDRTDIIRFRAVHSWVFVFSHLFTAWGILTASVPLIIAGRLWMGVGLAGGRIAWTMGHHDLAPPDRAAQYMSVHVMLTGVRGVFAPYLGVLLLTGITTSAGRTILPPLGGWTFAIFALLSALGAMLFVRLWRRVKSGADSLAGAAALSS